MVVTVVGIVLEVVRMMAEVRTLSYQIEGKVTGSHPRN
jgi:hypothetical protein